MALNLYKGGSTASQGTARIPSASRAGQARLARAGHVELQASANQPESYYRRTNAWDNHRTNGDGLLEQSHMPVGCHYISTELSEKTVPIGTLPCKSLMTCWVNMTLKETWWRSTIKHANGRTMQCGIRNIWSQDQARPETAMGGIGTCHCTKNTNLLRGARHWHPPSGNGRLSHASCHTACQRIPGCTRNPALLAVPAANWITSAASHWRVGTEPMWEQSGGNPWADAGRETRPHQEGWRRNAHCHRTR